MQTDKTSMRAQTKNEVWIPATSEKEETLKKTQTLLLEKLGDLTGTQCGVYMHYLKAKLFVFLYESLASKAEIFYFVHFLFFCQCYKIN